MKNKIFSTLATIAMAGLAMTSCTPEDFDLGTKALTPADLTEGVAYSVVVDQETNTVTMKSLLPSSYTVLWEYDGGRSQKPEVSTQYPFSGDKYVVFGVETRGGHVYGDTCWIHINNLKPQLLEDELWSIISGGIGQSKTWVLDLDANGVSQRFGGAIWFWTAGYTWDALHTAAGENFLDADPWDPTAAIAPFLDDSGAAQWYWAADWAGNGWIGDAADYGEMTFDLDNGANVTTDMSGTGLGTFKGSWMLDVKNHTISFTDAWPVVTPNYWGQITSELPSRTFEILYLNENNMMLLATTSSTPITLNFIRKGWVPEIEVSEKEVEDPDYGGDANTDLTTTTNTTKQWMLVEDAPYDWFYWDNAAGEWTSNGFSKPSDYGTWAPQADKKKVGKFLLTLSKNSDTAGQYMFNDMDGNTYDGKYTVENGNKFVFDQQINWFSATNDSEHPWSVSINTSELYLLQNSGTKTKPIYWFGTPSKWDSQGRVTEYLSFKVEEFSSEGRPAVPARNVTVNNANLYWGDLEGKGNFRIELSNHWDNGHENESAAVMASDIYFDEKCVINFTVSGFGQFAESRTGFIMCSAAGIWSAEEGVNTFEFKGDGTYEATITGTAVAESSDMVFLIDVLDAQSQTDVDLNGSIVNQTLHDAGIDVVINSVKMDGSEATGGNGGGGGTTPKLSRTIDVNNDKLFYGDLEGKGYFRIQFFNCYGGQQGDDAAVNWADIYCDEKIVINFTVSGLGEFASPVNAYVMSSVHNYWGPADNPADNSFEFKGDGTYEVTLKGAAEANESLVYLIDCVDAQAQTSIDLNGALVNNNLMDAGVTVTINSMKAD